MVSTQKTFKPGYFTTPASPEARISMNATLYQVTCRNEYRECACTDEREMKRCDDSEDMGNKCTGHDRPLTHHPSLLNGDIS